MERKSFILLITYAKRYPLGRSLFLLYYCWDILATAYLARPHLYQVVEQETDIIATGISQGRTIIKPGGKKIRVMEKIDKESFYHYLLQQFAT